MLKLIIERWSRRDGGTDHLWSLWQDGKRVGMAPKAVASAEDAEREAQAVCLKQLGKAPDRVEKL